MRNDLLASGAPDSPTARGSLSCTKLSLQVWELAGRSEASLNHRKRTLFSLGITPPRPYAAQISGMRGASGCQNKAKEWCPSNRECKAAPVLGSPGLRPV